MRVKILLAILLMLSLFLVMSGGAAPGDISCEFKEARDIAMSAPADADGDHISMVIRIDKRTGGKVGVGVCYFLKDNAVSGILVSETKVISVIYFEDVDKYMVETGNAKTMKRYSFKEIPKEDAIMFMRNLLKAMSYNEITQ